MSSILTKTPRLVHWLFPERVWAFSRSNPAVYLTFDDGPIPEITSWVLVQLQKYEARATFFCIGDNLNKHPKIAHQILAEGHQIGNHTYHHKNGWRTSLKSYLEDVEKFNLKFRVLNSEFENKQSSIKNLKSKIPFRPPYGKMTSKQAKSVLKNGHKIIMWDVLSRDYDQNISEEKCLHNVISNIQQGSIVVFHDSLKAEKNLKHVLPKVLEHIKNKGWNCEAIP